MITHKSSTDSEINILQRQPNVTGGWGMPILTLSNIRILSLISVILNPLDILGNSSVFQTLSGSSIKPCQDKMDETSVICMYRVLPAKDMGWKTVPFSLPLSSHLLITPS